MGRLAEVIANTSLAALGPQLKELHNKQQLKIGIRVTIHPEKVWE